VRACVRACVRMCACVCLCVRASECVCVDGKLCVQTKKYRGNTKERNGQAQDEIKKKRKKRNDDVHNFDIHPPKQMSACVQV